MAQHSTLNRHCWFAKRASFAIGVISALAFTFLFIIPCIVSAFSDQSMGSQPVQILPAPPVLPVSQATSELAKGKFLVASRNLEDPNFSETVILLLAYSQDGALGVVINRPTEVPLSSLLPKVKGLQKRKDFVHLGGPVARTNLLLLAQSNKQPKDSQHVFADLYLIANQATLEQVIDKASAKTKVCAYVGYAGWSAGQLDMEVTRGGWYIVPADAASIFDKVAEDVWPELIRRGEAQWTKSRRGEALAQGFQPN